MEAVKATIIKKNLTHDDDDVDVKTTTQKRATRRELI
jgi:hypothetical protein